MSNEELMDIRRRLNEMRGHDKADKRWDLNLCEGVVREEIAKRMADGRLTLEIKSDYIVQQSGNVAIEYECRGKPSGISTTKAAYWWIFFSGKWYFDEVSIIIETERLRGLARHYYKEGCTADGGDDNAAKMVLIPKEALLDLGR